MIRLISLSVMLTGLVACASTEPQAEVQNVNVVPAAEAGYQAAASDDSMEVLAVPAAQQKGKNRAKKEDYLVCKEELILGTHQKEEVCRYKSDIEEERRATQRAIRRASMRPRNTY